MTTMSGQGASPNAGPVARLQAELEQVEGALTMARAGLHDAHVEIALLRYERDEARALVPETLVCW